MLVIHNAPFDVGFLNAELARMAKAALSMDRVVDTLQMARQRFRHRPALMRYVADLVLIIPIVICMEP